jgi:hypothetical protein
MKKWCLQKKGAPSYTDENLYNAIEEGDIYYIATHGGYDLTKEKLHFTVPKDTFILETQALGDLCMPTIDEPLWVLSQGEHRDAFVGYLSGTSLDGTTESTQSMAIRRALSYLTLYGPGDVAPIRLLSIASGTRTPRTFPMGIYGLRSTSVALPFPPSGASKVAHNIEAPLWVYGTEKTNETIIEQILNKKTATTPRIFIFISCAVHESINGDRVKMDRWRTIAQIQHQARLNATEAGILTLAGGSMAPSRNLLSLPLEKIENPGYKKNAMRIPGPTVSTAMVEEDAEETAPACTNGYGILVNTPKGVQSLSVCEGTDKQRNCLTEDEMRKALEDNMKQEIINKEIRIASIVKYGPDGSMIAGGGGGGGSMGGGYRRTLRRRKRRLNKSKRNRGNARR